LKKSNSRNVVVLAAVSVVVLGLVGCGGGGGFSCSDKGKCPNDPASTQAEINECNAALSGACASEFKAVGSCAVSTQKCDSGGNTDAGNFLVSCSVQLNALSNCCNAHPGTAGC
jgi:hypothetical protein